DRPLDVHASGSWPRWFTVSFTPTVAFAATDRLHVVFRSLVCLTFVLGMYLYPQWT
ncbi:MAG: hypothetical protein Q9184_008059, partial [Pyrenodesmia sp. 2 TL-2023]